MSDLDATTPRVFLARHGETEWTKSGQYTGKTDIELTEQGIKQVTSTGSRLVGQGKLIDPSAVVHVWVSPRRRALKTFELLFGGTMEKENNNVTVTEDIAEWDYGEYEGLLVGQIKERRRKQGLDVGSSFNIWRDGCEGGESPEQVTERLDRLIAKIKEHQQPYMNNEKPADVVLVAHGLILRCFVKRWLNYPLDFPLSMMMPPGAISNHDINEPAFNIGIALPADA
ncbi:phosphoglycerate mutase [Lepidopterella palustris CBS 459.81]|uniref:Phosphoglycerate mutase n=1 Tax=Lepidopterella palustris CBS 459.81 TaxID=1314670 RepID=A0A8E2DWF8_9PEZI|nr:phosphoglycerate mutase [Lepidopterella palustris CBS 459.81]